MPVGTTTDFTLTRDQLITLAHKIIGVLPPGQVLSGDELQDGIQLLNLLVRETDQSGHWRWTIGAAATVPLVANTFLYSSSNGLPTNIAELLDGCSYRNADAQDVRLELLQAEGYERISDKIQIGDPCAIYLTEHRDLASRTLYVWPTLNSVNTQSVVTGTDSNAYRCIRSHTASSDNRPITGANYLLYWEAGGTGPTAWASATSYTAPQLLRLLYRRPLFDFDTASDTPDFPQQWPRLLLYKLAFDLGDLYGIPLAERQLMVQKAKGAYDDIFPSVKAKSTDWHGKARFF
jgi:hypothetical protein